MNGTSHKRQEGHNGSNDMHVFARIRPVDNINGENNRRCVEVHRDGRGVTVSDGQRSHGFSFDEVRSILFFIYDHFRFLKMKRSHFSKE